MLDGHRASTPAAGGPESIEGRHIEDQVVNLRAGLAPDATEGPADSG